VAPIEHTSLPLYLVVCGFT